MPTYEYLCAKGHAFEVFQRISDKPRAKCPVCGARASRVISGGAGLIFKGSGFYITDYGKDGKGPRKAGDTAGGESSAGGTADAGETKPAESKPAEPAAKKPEPAAAESKPEKKKGKSARE
jgi:putative FmdB family regulatory protein